MKSIRNMVKWIAGLVILALLSAGAYGYCVLRGHSKAECLPYVSGESSKQLFNSNRGFYKIYSFMIEDSETDYDYELAAKLAGDNENSLSMIQINLVNYREGQITKQGISNIKNLFEALKEYDKRYIVRFLYDWDGKCSGREPDNIDIILKHMEQTGSILNEYKDIIYTLQGLFIGNYAEMNASPYTNDEDIIRLSKQLSLVTDSDIFLAVRTPAFYRTITQADAGMKERLGLFNDGMLGSDTDLGSYKENERNKEIEFQNDICKSVPNGGEVVIDNEYNDIYNAISDLKRMHVTYINDGYDAHVLEKWSKSTVSEDSCFDGMDGLTYIERHLGYRYYIEDVNMEYEYFPDKLCITTNVRNRGFAPNYNKMKTVVTLKNKSVLHSYELVTDKLYEETAAISNSICLRGFEAGEYEVYFALKDEKTGACIELANEEEACEYGYRIGTVKLLPFITGY